MIINSNFPPIGGILLIDLRDVMKSEKKIQKEKEFMQKSLHKLSTQLSFDEQVIDLEALYEPELSITENVTKLMAHLGTLGLLKPEYNKEKYDAENAEYIAEYERQELESLKDKPIDDYYGVLKKYVKLVAKSPSLFSLFAVGEHGRGKTFNIIQSLIEENIEFVYYSGKLTPKALYQELFKNNGKIFFFDDTIGMLKDADVMSLLFAALWSSTDKRIVRWTTSRKIEELPNEFIFTGKVLFSLNKVPNNEEFKTLLSRCLSYEIKFSYNELLCIMEKIAEQKHDKLTTEQRKEILEFIKANTDSSVASFDLRLQKKAESLFLETSDWKELLLPQLSKNNLRYLARSLSEKEFIEKTDMSRRSYYRLKN